MIIHIGNALFAILQGLKGTLIADSARFPNTKLRIQRIDRVCNSLLNGHTVETEDLKHIMGFCSAIRGRTKAGYEKTAIAVIDRYLSEMEQAKGRTKAQAGP